METQPKVTVTIRDSTGAVLSRFVLSPTLDWPQKNDARLAGAVEDLLASKFEYSEV